MNWKLINVYDKPYDIEGVGFIDSLHGWTGGEDSFSFETKDGGTTWDTINICPYMNRVFKVNDSLLFAVGEGIWKFSPDKTTGLEHIPIAFNFANLDCDPNPASNFIHIKANIHVNTQLHISCLNSIGVPIKLIENSIKDIGEYHYNLNTSNFQNGSYFIVLKTHEAKVVKKIIVAH
jgi:Secretion system C-terminal sorting domain